MYKIVGADGRQYGPITVEQLKEWIAQGRVNPFTLAQMEGSTDWKPLSQFPELTPHLAGATVPPVIHPFDDRKSRLVAGLLGILLGGLGIHRFYLGYVGIGIAQILVTLFTCFAGWIWGLIEGILILTGSTITTDAEGRPLKD